MTPEGKVKLDIKKWLFDHGLIRAGSTKEHWPENPRGWYYMPMQNGMGVHGIPDFICCVAGKFISIEAKAPGKEPTENQKDRGDEINLAGGTWIVVDNIQTLNEIDWIFT